MVNDAETFNDALKIFFEYFPKWMPLALSSCTITIYYVVFRIRLRIAQWRAAERRRIEKKYSLLEDLHELSMLTCNDESSFSGKEKLFFASKSGRITATPKRVKISQPQSRRKANKNSEIVNANTINCKNNKNAKDIYSNECGSRNQIAKESIICTNNEEINKGVKNKNESNKSSIREFINNNKNVANAYNSNSIVDKDDESSCSETDLENETESNDSFDNDDEDENEDEDETAVSMQDVEEFRSSLGIRLPRDDDLLALIERMLLLDPIPQGWVLYRTTAGLIRFMNVNTQELFFFPPNKRRLQKYVEHELTKRNRQVMENKYVILYEDESHSNNVDNNVDYNPYDVNNSTINNSSSSSINYNDYTSLHYREQELSHERSPEPSHECTDSQYYISESALQHRNTSVNNTNNVQEEMLHFRRASADTPANSSRWRDYFYDPHTTHVEANSMEALELGSKYTLDEHTDNNNSNNNVNKKNGISNNIIMWEEDNSSMLVNDNDSTFKRIFRYFKEKEQRRIEEEVARSRKAQNAPTITDSIPEITTSSSNIRVHNKQ